MTTNSTSYDVLIIGAGPSGTSAAAVLAEKGRKVLILEREKFPRYHIGESLLPFTYYPLDRLGLIPKMKESHFVKKYSVIFVKEDGKAADPFYFYTRYDKDTVAQSWQVVRSEFDVMLRDNAIEKGAEVLEETKVTELIMEGKRVAGVLAVGPDGKETEYRAKITLDCSGKDAFSSTRRLWRINDPFLNNIAVWTYYKGAKREPGLNEGATIVAFTPEKGWFWYIPQHDDMVSVGVVGKAKYLTRDGVRKPEEIFKRAVPENKWIEEHLAQGEQVGDYYVTNEYSRHSNYGAAPGLLLVGDAFAFLDPVFSSGVMIAMNSGILAGDYVNEGIEKGDLSPKQFMEYSNYLKEGIENMRKLVYAFYDSGFSFKKVIERYPETAGMMTDCLSGDVNRDYSELWEKISEFAELPDALPYGLPLDA